MERSDGDDDDLRAENAELKLRLQELEDTLRSIQSGEVDALVVNDDIYTLESASDSSQRLKRVVLDQMDDAVFAFDLDDHLIYLNAAAERRYGVASADALGRARDELFVESDRRDLSDSGFGALPGDPLSRFESLHTLTDGTTLYVESSASPLSDGGDAAIGSLEVVRDVTERRGAELRRDSLVALNERLRQSEDVEEIGFHAARLLGETLGASRVAYATIDESLEQLHIARDWTAPGTASAAGTLDIRMYGAGFDELRRGVTVAVDDVRLDSRAREALAVFLRREVGAFVGAPLIEQGRLVAVVLVVDANPRGWSADEIAFVREVAERTRTVAERARNAAALRESERRLREVNENLESTVLTRTRELMEAEQALRQAQKMEAVGQLTGGIAHDFNNLLAGMSASLQVLQARLTKGRFDDVDRYLSIAQDSVRRAAALTQRLLAFARRQTLDPKPTDVPRLIEGMADLINRSVGPTVEVVLSMPEPVGPTRIDASQLENALLNLCINARDAMLPEGGRLTIAAAEASLDAQAAAARDLPSGRYVAISVSDTGTGMTPELVKRVFDPFFTTKPLGQGTGLGLSMVYGFVRQSGGQVRVHSTPGAGTTMKLYLPRYLGPSVIEERPAISQPVEAGDGETVLLIEDDDTVRRMVAESLEESGYRVLIAEDGPRGLKLLESEARIDLLLTDVGLPGGMNGRQVADAGRVLRPALKVLFITGYAESAAAVGNGAMEEGMEILAKPFDIAVLAAQVRRMTRLRSDLGLG